MVSGLFEAVDALAAVDVAASRPPHATSAAARTNDQPHALGALPRRGTDATMARHAEEEPPPMDREVTFIADALTQTGRFEVTSPAEAFGSYRRAAQAAGRLLAKPVATTKALRVYRFKG